MEKTNISKEYNIYFVLQITAWSNENEFIYRSYNNNLYNMEIC